jgi:hypothetical protein
MIGMLTACVFTARCNAASFASCLMLPGSVDRDGDAKVEVLSRSHWLLGHRRQPVLCTVRTPSLLTVQPCVSASASRRGFL